MAAVTATPTDIVAAATIPTVATAIAVLYRCIVLRWGQMSDGKQTFGLRKIVIFEGMLGVLR